VNDLNTRAAAIFGTSEGEVRWPYDVSGIDRTLRHRDPEAFRHELAVLTTKRYTIVEWAEVHGLKASRVKCCPLWLTRQTSRRCRFDSPCQYRTDPDRSWLDHDIYWLRNSRPAVITSAPYDISPQSVQRLKWWHATHRHLKVATGEGWYGHGTSQVVMWSTTRIEYVSPAKNIDQPSTFMRSHD
jgi:hypothetical protein